MRSLTCDNSCHGEDPDTLRSRNLDWLRLCIPGDGWIYKFTNINLVLFVIVFVLNIPSQWSIKKIIITVCNKNIVFLFYIIPGDRDSNFLFLGKLDTQEDRCLEFDGKI